MITIKDILIKYHKKLDFLDLELLIVNAIKKPREFVLAHPEYEIPKFKIENLKFKIARRAADEPLAYILGYKEFYGLNFKVNKHTLIPRPETELLAEEALDLLRSMLRSKSKLHNITVIDVGTGSGNIIVSLAKQLELGIRNNELRFFGTDISESAIKIARYNAKKHNVNNQIKFIRGNLLDSILKNTKYIIPDTRYIILANLPYLSKEIYNAAAPNVKKYEPKSALLSGNDGLSHYKKLFKQIKELLVVSRKLSVFLEISHEQKPAITKLVKSYFPQAKTSFYKDLAGRWRICKVNPHTNNLHPKHYN